MSERYSRLFMLPENLYAAGAPVVIAAGTLLKDNQTGKIVAQLKFRSISGKTIRAVTVRLSLFDIAGNPIDQMEYDYLDLCASRDLEFGQKTPVPVAADKARSYIVSVAEVVFSDKSTWKASDAAWTSLPRQKTLEAALVDNELIRQYQIALGSNLSYYPLNVKDLWYCACGALNHEEEPCHSCHRTLFELQTIDLTQLAKSRDERLAQESADAAAKAAAKKAAQEAVKKKTAKILKITISAVCAIVAVTLLTIKLIIPYSQYAKAVSLMEAGQYEEAIADFEALNGFLDAEQYILTCYDEAKYQEAVALMEAGQYEKAIARFEKLKGFRDSEQQILSCYDGINEAKYQEAIALMEQGAYDDALSILMEIEDYKDSKQLIADCEEFPIEAQYQLAVELMSNREYESARNYFQQIADYKDSEALIQTCNQALKIGAVRMMEAGHYRYALKTFMDLAEYDVDCRAEIQECELHVLEENGAPYITAGTPIGNETNVNYYRKGNTVTVHSFTRVELDNRCVRFTINFTCSSSGLITIFNPPDGDIFMYYDVSGIKKGQQTIVFDVLQTDAKAVREMTLNLANTWVFVSNPY